MHIVRLIVGVKVVYCGVAVNFQPFARDYIAKPCIFLVGHECRRFVISTMTYRIETPRPIAFKLGSYGAYHNLDILIFEERVSTK